MQSLASMSEHAEETQPQKELKDMSWDELKKMLREMEKTEKYEICRMIQDEIDERVKHISI